MLISSAVVKKIDARSVIVTLDCSPGGDGCAGCRLASVCRQDRAVDLAMPLPDGIGLEVGDRVGLKAGDGLRRRAVVFLLAVPVAALLTAISAVKAAGFGDTTAGLAGLAAVVGSYLFVRFATRGRAGKGSWKIVEKYTNYK